MSGCALRTKSDIREKFANSANKKVVSELKGFKSLGFGWTSSVGLEHVELCFNSPSHDLQTLQEEGKRAYTLSREVLKDEGELFDYTNHGPTSPNFPVIFIYYASQSYQSPICIFNGKYVKDTNPFSKEKEGLELTALLEEISNSKIVPSNARLLIHQLSQIEEDVPAVMLGYVFDNSTILMDDAKQVEIYKKLYPKLQKAVQEKFGGECFLGLELRFKRGRVESLVWNIRNNVRVCLRNNSNEKYPEKNLIAHEALNEWIPNSLHRKIK